MSSKKVPSNENVYTIRLPLEVRNSLKESSEIEGISARKLARNIITEYFNVAA